MTEKHLAVVPQMQLRFEPPSASTWQIMKEEASVLLASRFLPSAIRTAEQALAVMLKARELNVPSMYALTHISIIDGKPSVSAEMMMALVRRAYGPSAIRVKLSTAERCVVEYRVPGWDGVQSAEFTMADAQQAGLWGKATWKNYPKAMLRSRAVSLACREGFPECIGGLYAAGEMGEPVTITAEDEVIAVGTYRVGVSETDQEEVDMNDDPEELPEISEAADLAEEGDGPADPKSPEWLQANRDLHGFVSERLYPTSAKDKAEGKKRKLTKAERLSAHLATRHLCIFHTPLVYDENGERHVVRSMTQIPAQELVDIFGWASILPDEVFASATTDWLGAIAGAQNLATLERVGLMMKEAGIKKLDHVLYTDAYKDRLEAIALAAAA